MATSMSGACFMESGFIVARETNPTAGDCYPRGALRWDGAEQGDRVAGHESTRVLLTALAANVGIAIAKFVAAAITGSSAMLTEGVHSLVDSTNQVLLLYGQKRSRRAPNAVHPLGYGRELYFWSFVVAILVFSLGAGVSLYEGVLHLLYPEPTEDLLIAFVVLGVAIALEGWSTLAALREFNFARGRKSVFRAIRDTKDAPNLIVLLENSGAIAGLVIAGLGIALSAVTGSPMYDGIASVLIGLVLAGTAVMLLIEAKGLLIGEAADPELVRELHRCIEGHAEIVAVRELLTVHQAPDMVVVIVSADFEDAITARDVEKTVARIEAEIAEKFPVVTRVYVRPMGAPA
jgi:cation diffusion facilitator family transporter